MWKRKLKDADIFKITEEPEIDADEQDNEYLSSITDISIIPERLDELKEEITKLGKVLVRIRISSESEYKALHETISALSVSKDDDKEIVDNLLLIADGLDSGIRAGEEMSVYGTDSWINGIKIVQQRMLELLEKLNIQPIDCIRDQFDPSFHVAVGVDNNPDFDDNIILDEHRRGYIRSGKILRYAEVVVNKRTNAAIVND